MVPLIARSHFSLLRGTASVADLCRAAVERGFQRIALTDTDNLYGLWEYLRYCRRNGMKPIIGAEITDPVDRSSRAVCLTLNTQGFRNLCRLLSRRHLDQGFRLSTALPGLDEGLIVLTSSEVLLQGWAGLGLRVTAALPIRPSGRAYALRQSAIRMGLPYTIVPDSFFLAPEDYERHRLLRAIAGNTTLSHLAPHETAPAEAWLASSEEYRRRFEIWPEAWDRSDEIADRLSWDGPDGAIVMPPWSCPDGLPADELLRRKSWEGAQARYGIPVPATVRQRLDYELGVIAGKNFSSYFLVVQDIVRRSPRICGRGSGAASLVAYCLGITNVCPLKFHLYFERFLNPGRKDPPDIDVDFAWDERDAVLSSVLDQYRGRSAMVCNHVLFQGRMALREIAKVFGLPDFEIKQFIKELPWLHHPWGEEAETETVHEPFPANIPLDYPAPWPQILKMTVGLLKTPRYLSVHPGGMIITPGPIEDFAPLEMAPKGIPIIQWEKDGAEESGLVKIDLLGNRSLGVIRDAIAAVRSNRQIFEDARWEPEDDPQTQTLVARGDTMGCFYIESPATRLLQRKAAVGDYEHLVIHSSIIRPAANPYIQEYLRRLKGGDWQPIHPLLRHVLDETFGIMVYQEDVSKSAVAIAGFSEVEADGLRKILSKKDKEFALKDHFLRFQQGARRRGVTDEQILAVWKMILSFSGYSFCKSHSASYARVSFQAAFLKTHFPAEFMAAVISNQGGFYNTFAYVSEARRLGLRILPPDVNQSAIAWTGRERSVRVGWLSVKDLSAETQKRILCARTEDGPYTGFENFLDRVRPEEDETRALIDAGAFAAISAGTEAAELLWRLAQRKRRRERGGHARLFDSLEETPSPSFPPEPEISRLRRQFAALGFLVDRHPMHLYRNLLSGRRRTMASDLFRFIGRRISTAGWLITGKTVFTCTQELMQFLTFEDESGLIETVFFPEAYRRFCRTIDWGRPYYLSGLIEENYGAVTLTVDRAELLPRLPAGSKTGNFSPIEDRGCIPR